MPASGRANTSTCSRFWTVDGVGWLPRVAATATTTAAVTANATASWRSRKGSALERGGRIDRERVDAPAAVVRPRLRRVDAHELAVLDLHHDHARRSCRAAADVGLLHEPT